MSYKPAYWCWYSLFLAAIIAFGNPSNAAAEDYYFTTIYGAQRPILNQPRYTHTWATYIKLSGEGGDWRTYRVEHFTISWLAATRLVNPRKLRAEPGVNLTLAETIEWCDENRMEIAQFGPYRVQPELWNLAMKRKQSLEAGEMKYRASDLLNSPVFGETCNCIYSVLDIDGKDITFRYATLGFGYKGAAFVERRYKQWIIDREQTYPWVNERAGYGNYPPVRFGLAALLAR